MKKCWRLLPLLVVLAGCGSSSHTSTSTSTSTSTLKLTPAPGHQCAAGNYAMQCALIGQPHPGPTLGMTIAKVAYGVDFAWAGPRSCSQMRALGAKFIVGYLSYDAGKNLGSATVNEARKCGVATVVGWETTQYRATQGFAAGVSDAQEASRQAAALGNTHDAIWFAIDFDANGPDVISYFKGAQSVLGSRVNAYGGYRPLAYLHAHGAVGNLNFQTYAWSGGAWLPASIAPLEQYLNGNEYDNDRAIAANYGQFPAPQVGPSRSTVHGWEAARNHAYLAYRFHRCRFLVSSHTCHVLGHRVVANQKLIWTVTRRQACFGKRSTPRSRAGRACSILRPTVARYWRDRDNAQLAYARLRCESPASFGAPSGDPRCKVWKRRIRTYTRDAKAIVNPNL